MSRQQILRRRLVLILVFIIAYLVIGVVAFCVIRFIGSAIIANGTSNELGRIVDGMGVVFFGSLSSFCIIPPVILLAFLILIQKSNKRKPKVKNDYLISN